MNRSAACTGNTFGKGDEAVITACAEEYDPHSHSILSIHRNALIYQRKFFLPMLGIRTTTRQNFLLMIPKENPGDPDFARFRGLSTTIGRFSTSSTTQRPSREHQKTPSAL